VDPRDKSALKAAYKQQIPDAGVFKIEHHVSGRLFVGSSMNLPGILNRYRAELRTGGCRIPALQEDWSADGEAQFSFEILEVLAPRKGETTVRPDDLKTCEALWLEELQPFGDRGYNRP
jgi:hypothetical protein